MIYDFTITATWGEKSVEGRFIAEHPTLVEALHKLCSKNILGMSPAWHIEESSLKINGRHVRGVTSYGGEVSIEITKLGTKGEIYYTFAVQNRAKSLY